MNCNSCNALLLYYTDHVLNILFSFTVPPLPPLNVQATQSSASAPVEVSWSPPTSGATNITGYRIFYGNGKNVSVPSVVTIIGLALNKDSVGETVSVRSEADQLFSEYVTITITVGRLLSNLPRNVRDKMTILQLLQILIDHPPSPVAPVKLALQWG